MEYFGILLKVYKALVFMYLYNWFIPTLFGLSELNFLMSLGILLIVDLLNERNYIMEMHYIDSNIDKEKRVIYNAGVMIGKLIVYSLIWLIGWTIHLFV